MRKLLVKSSMRIDRKKGRRRIKNESKIHQNIQS